MASKIEVNLDTSKELYEAFKCKQNDDLILIANIYENGAAKDLTNCSIVVQAKKSDNTYVIQNTDIEKLNNTFTAELVRDFTRTQGETKIEVVLAESGKQNTTFSFCLEVVESVIKGAEKSKDLITSLEKMQDAVVEMGKISEETKELIQNSGAASKEDFNKVNTQLAEITTQKASKEELNIQANRISNIISNNNPTEGNSELIDIRTSSDGLVYGTSGKAVRKQYENLKNMIKNKRENAIFSILQKGGIANGVITSPSDNRIVTTNFSPLDTSIEIVCNSGYKWTIVFYNDDETSNYSWGWNTTNAKITDMQYYYNFTKFRVVYAKTNDSNLTFDEAQDNIIITRNVVISPSPKTVSESTLDDTVGKFKRIVDYRLKLNDYIVQLFNPLEVNKTGMWTANGTFWTTTNYYSTGFFPIVDGMIIRNNYTTEGNSAILTLWDKEEKYIQNDELKINGNNPTITIPSGKGACWGRMSIPKQLYRDDIQIVNSDKIPAIYMSYLSSIPKNYANVYSNYVGKKLGNFGDSITAGGTWQPTVVKKLGLSGYQGFSQSGGTLVDIYQQISGIDADCGIITIWIGTNDFGTSKPLGTINDTDVNPTTFYGCYKYILKYVSTNYPKARIIVITPMMRDDYYNVSYGTDDFGRSKNGQGLILEDYVNAVINVSKLFSIPVLDMYHNGGINKYNMSEYLYDKLHPHADGGVKIGRIISEFINNN